MESSKQLHILLVLSDNKLAKMLNATEPNYHAQSAFLCLVIPEATPILYQSTWL